MTKEDADDARPIESDGLPSIAELVSLRGRVAVVTGAGPGMSRAIAVRLAEAGATVTVADVSATAAAETAREVTAATGAACVARTTDISDADAVNDLAQATMSEFGRLDIWVNSAAMFATNPLQDITDDLWRRVTAVDLDGPFYCARAAVEHMRTGGRGGVIVFVTSLSAHKGRSARAHYGAAKAGVAGLMKSLAVELGSEGIRVLAVAPSVTNTAAIYGGSEDDPELNEEVVRRAAADMPLGRIAEPDEVARVVLFAVSDMATFVTGSTLHADGGGIAT